MSYSNRAIATVLFARRLNVCHYKCYFTISQSKAVLWCRVPLRDSSHFVWIQDCWASEWQKGLDTPCLCAFHKALAIQNKNLWRYNQRKQICEPLKGHRNPLHSHQSTLVAFSQQKQGCSLLCTVISHSPKQPFVCVIENQIKHTKSISHAVCLNQ